jgi:prevent-host-death family protein
MTVTTLSSRELNADLGMAKRSANAGPVIITDRGRPSHVLLSFAEYRRLTHSVSTLGQLLASPQTADIDLPLPRRSERAVPVAL